MINNTIGFTFKSINTEQFAIIKENCKDSSNIELKTGLGFGLDKENRMLQVRLNVIFEDNKLPFIILQVACFFEITQDSFSAFMVQDDGKLVVPCGLAKHLSVLTIGTARGVLHTKTENTEFNKFLLPTINVEEMVKEDLVF